jgi:hypothetical protein
MKNRLAFLFERLEFVSQRDEVLIAVNPLLDAFLRRFGAGFVRGFFRVAIAAISPLTRGMRS